MRLSDPIRVCHARRRRRPAGLERGPEPPSFIAWSTAAPAAISAAAVSVWPFWQAMKSGVAPVFIAWSTFAPAASSVAAIRVWSFAQAMWSGVTPLPTDGSLGSAPSSSRAEISSMWPCRTASMSGVSPGCMAERRSLCCLPRGASAQRADRAQAPHRAYSSTDQYLYKQISRVTRIVIWGCAQKLVTRA